MTKYLKYAPQFNAKLYVKTDLIVVTRTHYADLAADAAIERERKAEHQAIQALFDDKIDDGINIIVGPNRQNDGDQHNNNVEILWNGGQNGINDDDDVDINAMIGLNGQNDINCVAVLTTIWVSKKAQSNWTVCNRWAKAVAIKLHAICSTIKLTLYFYLFVIRFNIDYWNQHHRTGAIQQVKWKFPFYLNAKKRYNTTRKLVFRIFSATRYL